MKRCLALMLALSAPGRSVAELPSADSLRQGCAFDGGSCGGETRLLQKAIDESPTLTKMFQDAGRGRTWRDY